MLSSSNMLVSGDTPQTGSTTSVPFNSLNRWTLASADSAGNQTTINTQSANIKTLTYDAGERVIQSQRSNPAATVSFTYDGDGPRVTKATASGTTMYVYDPAGNVAAEYGGAVKLTDPLVETFNFLMVDTLSAFYGGFESEPIRISARLSRTMRE
jgi:YD repeat-containing protein